MKGTEVTTCTEERRWGEMWGMESCTCSGYRKGNKINNGHVETPYVAERNQCGFHGEEGMPCKGFFFFF